jgi:phage terminase small subunit
MGRPPKPLEQKRLTGRSPGRDSGGRALPKRGEVVALPMAAGVPDCPADLGLMGRQLWERAWDAAITWLSPNSDMAAVEAACRLEDDLATARERYRVTRDPCDGRMVVAFSKELAAALAALGFDPASRTRLGVAEVTRVSKLEALRASRER